MEQNLIVKDKIIIRRLIYQSRNYDGFTKMITAIKLRARSILGEDYEYSVSDEIALLKPIKNKFSRDIEKTMGYWPIWEKWLSRVKGVGPYIASNMIIAYYYRLIPYCIHCGKNYHKNDNSFEFTCDHCGKKSKGNGNLNHRIERRQFDTVSKWWKFLGRSPEEDGKLPRKKKGEKLGYNPKLKAVGYQFIESINKFNEDHPYKAYMLNRKLKRQRTHPDSGKRHIYNMAGNEAFKLFASHFWHVARTLEGQPTTGPYIQAICGHTNIISPFYWEP